MKYILVVGGNNMRYLITFAYDGSKYKGYQKQPKEKTVQGELEKALKTINGHKKVSVHASGRTDAGVHAFNQKAHFDLDIKHVTPEKLKDGLNSLLPKDIYIKNVEMVADDFHARFNAKYKVYEMLINFKEKNPFYRNYVVDSFSNISIKKCKEIAKYFVGRKNFMNYCSKEEDENNFIRTIKKIKIFKKNVVLHMIFVGDGFMTYQVRMISANILLYGQNKISKDEIIKRLNFVDKRDVSPYCLSAEGLYLVNVIY